MNKTTTTQNSMKLLITCYLLLTTSFLLSAQDWKHQITFNTGDIDDLACPDVNTCYAVGSYFGPNIWVTKDGQTWNWAINGVTGSMSTVHCWDVNTCIVGAGGGEIYKTTDGGSTWVWTYNFPSGYPMSQWQFFDSKNGLGLSGKYVYKTVDSGATWTSPRYITNQLVNSIHFVDMNTGFAAIEEWIGGPVSNAQILKTTNGGSSWSLVYEDTTGTTNIAKDVFFVNTNLGFAVTQMANCDTNFCNGKILKSTNGGTNWTVLNNPYKDTSKVYFNVVRFVDAQKGYVLGRNSNLWANKNIVLKTMDGGQTWTEETTAYPNLLLKIVFPGGDIGYIGGIGGLIMKSTTTGLSVGIKEISTQENIGSIYPNPFSENAELRIQNEEFRTKNLEFRIYDVLGREVFQTIINNQSTIINRNGLPNGIYFYQLRNEKQILANGKLIIQ